MIWVAVFIVGFGSYLLRALPLIVGTKLQLPQHVQNALRHADIGGMTVLLVFSLIGFRTTGGTTMVLFATAAVAAAAVVARRGASMAVVMLAGASVYGVIWLGAWVLS